LINEDPAMMKEFIGWLEFEVHIYRGHIKNFLTPLKTNGYRINCIAKQRISLRLKFMDNGLRFYAKA
jgi:hypothetical protein